MLASGHFQDAIEPPSASDVVVLIVYSRLGTALPERSGTREYRGIDGRAPVTGTEWEFEDALEAHRARGAPDLLAYRKIGDPTASLADSVKRAEQERQWDALQAFWRRYFEAGSLFLAGSSKFQTLDEFDQKLEADLVALIERRIAHGLEAAPGAAEATWFKGSPFRKFAPPLRACRQPPSAPPHSSLFLEQAARASPRWPGPASCPPCSRPRPFPASPSGAG
jgi:hypothetical protein